ncbi:hypothetical protein DZF79_04165 [Vibrio parahaemolyticus]|nr:hypothetical protein [Vibrio parahaemolyticus]
MKPESNNIFEPTRLASATLSLSIGDNVTIEHDELPTLINNKSADLYSHGAISKVSEITDISGIVTSRFHLTKDSYIETSFDEDDFAHNRKSLALWIRLEVSPDINQLPQEDQIRQITSRKLNLLGMEFERSDVYVLHEVTNCESKECAYFQESRFTSLYESDDGIVLKSVVNESENSGSIEYWQEIPLEAGRILVF